MSDQVTYSKYQWNKRIALETANGAVADVIRAKGFGATPSDFFPMVKASLPKWAVEEMRYETGIARIFYDDKGGRPASTHYVSAVGADVLDAYGWDGSLVRLAIMEGARPDDYSRLFIAGTRCSGAADVHSRWTSGIVHSTDAPSNGVADASIIYIANWDGCGGPDQALEWAITTAAANVINFSWNFAGCTDSSLSDTDMAFDYVAKNSPFPTIVAAAGNYDFPCSQTYTIDQVTVTNKGHNGLIVGATNDNNTDSQTNDTMADFSLFKNPYSDRELPNVVAPGVSLNAANHTDNGTSGSAPIVAGLVADLMERNTALKQWPEGIRAIMMASAHEDIDGIPPDLDDYIDEKDGAGEVDGVMASVIANPSNRWNGSPLLTGHDYTTMYRDSGWDANGFFTTTYSVPAGSQSRLRVAIAWDSTATCTGTYTCTADSLDADLDLYVYDQYGSLKKASLSYDNAIEYLDFAVESSKSYTIKIKKIWFSAAQSYTYFGIGWMRYYP